MSKILIEKEIVELALEALYEERDRSWKPTHKGAVAISAIKAVLASKTDCTRSHPHENMSKECELRTEITRLTNCLAKANAQAEHFEREWYLRGDEIERLKAQPSEASEQKLPTALRSKT